MNIDILNDFAHLQLWKGFFRSYRNTLSQV